MQFNSFQKFQVIPLCSVTVKLCIPTSYFLIKNEFQEDVCRYIQGGKGCQSGGLCSCRTTQSSRLSFHPSILQQPQKRGPLPGYKLNNNQSSCWLITLRHTTILMCLEKVMILLNIVVGFCYNNVICESV